MFNECARCHGSGVLTDGINDYVCPACDGTGAPRLEHWLFGQMLFFVAPLMICAMFPLYLAAMVLPPVDTFLGLVCWTVAGVVLLVYYAFLALFLAWQPWLRNLTAIGLAIAAGTIASWTDATAGGASNSPPPSQARRAVTPHAGPTPRVSTGQATAASPDATTPPAAEPPSPLRQLRTWTDRTGNFRTEAEFRGIVDGQVKLRKATGEEIAVPLDRLSDDDRALLNQHAGQ